MAEEQTMPKSMNQKVKLLLIRQMFLERTDTEHKITLEDISNMLSQNGIKVERKTLYHDIGTLINYGMDIGKGREDRNYYYCLLNRDFEFAEIKLLVDSVLSARFISEKKSRELIKKLSSLVSIYEAKNIRKRSVLSNKTKTMSENVFICIDRIQEAIIQNRQIAFSYWQWAVVKDKKEKVARHDNKRYQLSPYSLIWDNENYYLLAYDAQSDKMKHYRVDKMKNIEILQDECIGLKQYEKIDINEYKTGHFSMFGGEKTRIELLCDKSMAGVIIDRFGKDIATYETDPEHFKAHVDVYLSSQFLGWLIGLGSGVKLIGPSFAVERMKELLADISKLY